MVLASPRILKTRGLYVFLFIAIIFFTTIYFTNPVKISAPAFGQLHTSARAEKQPAEKTPTEKKPAEKTPADTESHDKTIFDNFDNVTGAEHFIVPNIIHFIRFQTFELNFVDYMVLLAAMRNHKPDKFFFHTNVEDVQFTGKYWGLVQQDEDLWSRIKVFFLEAPTEIFGQKLNEVWRFYHGSDIGRIHVLMKYGGIYFDNDAYVIRSLDKYRKFEFVINWDENEFIGTQVIIAHKDARFLPLWLDSYRDYHSDKWCYNAGERPTTEILHRKPELIHRVKGDFGAAINVSMQIYYNPKFDWRSYDALHLLTGHRYYLDPYFNKTPTFDENNIREYEFPIGDMAREVFDKFTGIID